MFIKVNWLFIKGGFKKSKEIYLEYFVIQEDFVQAIYNLGLEDMRLDLPEESSQAGDKLLTFVPNNVFYLLDS